MAEPDWKNRTLWTGDNLPLCAACNSSKGTRSQVEFLRGRMSRRSGAVPPWLIAPTKRGERLFEARG